MADSSILAPFKAVGRFLTYNDADFSRYSFVLAKYFLWYIIGAALLSLLFFAAPVVLPGLAAFGASALVAAFGFGAMAGLGAGLYATGMHELLDPGLRVHHPYAMTKAVVGGILMSPLIVLFGPYLFMSSVGAASVGLIMGLVTPLLGACFGLFSHAMGAWLKPDPNIDEVDAEYDNFHLREMHDAPFLRSVNYHGLQALEYAAQHGSVTEVQELLNDPALKFTLEQLRSVGGLAARSMQYANEPNRPLVCALLAARQTDLSHARLVSEGGLFAGSGKNGGGPLEKLAAGGAKPGLGNHSDDEDG